MIAAADGAAAPQVEPMEGRVLMSAASRHAALAFHGWLGGAKEALVQADLALKHPRAVAYPSVSHHARATSWRAVPQLGSGGTAQPAGPGGPVLSFTQSAGGGSIAPVNTNLGPPGTITTSNGPSGSNSSAKAVTVDASGNIIVAGYLAVPVTKGNLVAGNSYFQIDRYTPTGALDTSFGTGGGVTTAIGSYKNGGTYTQSHASAVAILPDGDILAVGFATVGTGREEFALAFYTPSGKLDTTRGGGTGEVITPVGTGNDLPSSVALQTVNGVTKIIVAGTYYVSSSSSYELALARYNLNGTLDTSFGSAGTLSWAPSGSGLIGVGMAVDSLGRVVVAGQAHNTVSGLVSSFIGRWNADGTGLDTTFGNGSGYVLQTIGGANTGIYAIAIQPDGKIVVGGYGGGGTAVLRDNPDGSPDTTFGTGGAMSFANSAGETDGLEILSSGEILLTNGAYYGPYANEAFGLAWVTSTGALDTNFGGGTGMVTTELPQSVFPLGTNPLAIQPSDGKIIEIGTYNGSGQFALVRYNVDGSLDTSF